MKKIFAKEKCRSSSQGVEHSMKLWISWSCWHFALSLAFIQKTFLSVWSQNKERIWWMSVSFFCKNWREDATSVWAAGCWKHAWRWGLAAEMFQHLYTVMWSSRQIPVSGDAAGSPNGSILDPDRALAWIPMTLGLRCCSALLNLVIYLVYFIAV